MGGCVLLGGRLIVWWTATCWMNCILVTHPKIIPYILSNLFSSCFCSDSEVFGGKFYLLVKYNGYNLYNNNWDLCTFDGTDGDDRIINCPFVPGDYNFVKDKPIPGYFAKVKCTSIIKTLNEPCHEIMALSSPINLFFNRTCPDIQWG